MKILNLMRLKKMPAKKPVSSIFFISFLIAISFLLATKANFLLAQSVSGQTCSLTVSLSPYTAPAQNITPGQTGVSLVKFNIVPSCNITLSSFAVSLMPASSGYQNMSSLQLYKDGLQLGSVTAITSTNLNFSGLSLSILANQTIVLEVKGNINSSAIAGSTVYGAFNGLTATVLLDSSAMNIPPNAVVGNIMTIAHSGDAVSPSAPSLLVATKDDFNEVDLSWTASTDNIGVAGYEIWRSANAVWAKIGQSALASYIDTTVSPSTPYYYKVFAFDAAGNKSLPSEPLFLNTPANNNLPLAPTGLALNGVSTASSIPIKWNDNSTNEDKFNIERKLTSAANYAFLVQVGTNISSYTDTTVSAGTFYDYRVQACRSGYGCSDYVNLTGIFSASNTPSPTPTPTPAATTAPDLTVTIDSIDKTTIVHGQTPWTWVTYHVDNIGTAVAYGPIYLRVLNNGVAKSGYMTIDSIAAGASSVSKTFAVGHDSSWPVGSYNIKLEVDYSGAPISVAEINETNNYSNEVIFTVVDSTVVVTPTPTPTVTITPYLNAWIDTVPTSSTYTYPTVISGVKNAALTSNFPVTSPELYINKISLTGTPESFNYYTSAVGKLSLVSGSMGTKWSGTIDTSNLAKGIYKFFAKGSNGATILTSNYVYFKVENTVVLTPTLTPTPTSVITVTPAITSTPYTTPTTTANPAMPSFKINTWIEGVPTSAISANTVNGVKKVFAYGYDTTLSSALLTGLSFRLYDAKSGAYIDYAPLAASADGNKNWAGVFDTAKIANGNYVFSAKGWYTNKDNITEYYYSNSINIYIDNSTIVTPVPSITSSVIPASFIIEFAEDYESQIISGDKKIAVVLNQEADSVSFNIQGSSNANIPAIKTDPLNYYFIWKTKDFSDGFYTLTAKAVKGTNTVYKAFSANTNNAVPTVSPAVTVYPTFSPVPAIIITQECKDKGFLTGEECLRYLSIPFQCRQQNITDDLKCKEYLFKNAMPEDCLKIGVTTQSQCSEIMLAKSLPEACRAVNIITPDACTAYLSEQAKLTAECRAAGIGSYKECISYMEKNFMPKECADIGIKTKEECDYALRGKTENLGASINIADNANSIEETSRLFKECGDKGITSKEDCEKYIIAQKFPKECRAANIIDKDVCEKMLFKKRAPQECVDSGVFDAKECEKIIFKKNAPKECRDAGVLNPEGCKKLMFEKYSSGNNIPPDNFPVECKKAGTKTSDECEKVIKLKYLPDECKINSIMDTVQCNTYLTKKYFPKECQDAGVSTLKECNETMFKKYAPVECKKAGILDEKECKDFMFNTYSSKVVCDNIDAWQCKNTVKDNRLGTIVAAQTQFNKIKEEASVLSGKSIKAAEIQKKIPSASNIIPITDKEAEFKIVSVKGNILLNEKNDLIQTAPVAVMIDSDGDGLPDDMEKRLGTNLLKADTDGDGYNDGEEVKAGYDPKIKGSDKLSEKIAPIDEAIMQNKVLSQPKTEGAASENLSISKVDNLETDQKNKKNGYSFSGKAEPNSVITLYVYSDLPVVMTVKADEYGNWKYELSNSLADGEHEVYVAINDNAGKVVTKSNPLSFFVKEAKAVSAKEFVDSVTVESGKTSEKSMNNYWIMVIFLIIIAVLISVVFIIQRKKHTV